MYLDRRLMSNESRGGPRKNRGKSGDDGEAEPHRKTCPIILSIMFFNLLGVS